MGKNDKHDISTKLLLKSGFWYTVSNFLTRAMVFITMPIFARIMSNAEYGDFSIYSNWQLILLTICGLEVYATLNKARFDFTSDDELNGYISSALLLSIIATGIVFVLYLIFPDVFHSVLLIDNKYMVVMFAYLFTYPSIAMFQAKQRIVYKYKLSAGLSFFLAISSAIASLTLVHKMASDRLYGRIIGQFGVPILVGLILLILFFVRSRKVSKKAIKYAFRLGMSLVFSYLGSQILLSCDNLVVKHLCSAEAVSYISVTHTTSHILLILVQTLNTAWAPWFFDMLKIEKNREIKKTFQIYLWGIVGVTFAVLLIGPEVIAILGAHRYREAIYILPANILCGIFTVLTAQFTNLETYYKRSEYASILTGIVAVLNVGLNIIGVKLFGYQAVCYTTIICQIILIMMHYKVTISMGIKDILDFKTVVSVLVAAVGIVPVMLLLYQKNMVRYISVVIIAIIIIVIMVRKKKEIIEAIKKFKKAK